MTSGASDSSTLLPALLSVSVRFGIVTSGGRRWASVVFRTRRSTCLPAVAGTRVAHEELDRPTGDDPITQPPSAPRPVGPVTKSEGREWRCAETFEPDIPALAENGATAPLVPTARGNSCAVLMPANLQRLQESSRTCKYP